jgi:hypothetical protein
MWTIHTFLKLVTAGLFKALYSSFPLSPQIMKGAE